MLYARPRASGTRGPAASTCSTTTATGCRRPAATPTPRTRSSCCARLTTRGGSPAGTSATPSASTCSSIPPSRGARCPSPSRSGTRARARCSGSSSGTTSNPRGGNRPWPIPGCGSPAGSTDPSLVEASVSLNGSRLDSGRRIEPAVHHDGDLARRTGRPGREPHLGRARSHRGPGLPAHRGDRAGDRLCVRLSGCAERRGSRAVRKDAYRPRQSSSVDALCTAIPMWR